MRDDDKPGVLPSVQKLAGLGFKVLATSGTARFLRENGVAAEKVHKVLEGHPDAMALVAFLQSVKPVSNPVPGPFEPGESVSTFIMRVLPPGETAAEAPK